MKHERFYLVSIAALHFLTRNSGSVKPGENFREIPSFPTKLRNHKSFSRKIF